MKSLGRQSVIKQQDISIATLSKINTEYKEPYVHSSQVWLPSETAQILPLETKKNFGFPQLWILEL